MIRQSHQESLSPGYPTHWDYRVGAEVVGHFGYLDVDCYNLFWLHGTPLSYTSDSQGELLKQRTSHCRLFLH